MSNTYIYDQYQKFQNSGAILHDLRYAKTQAFLCNSPDDDFACIVDGPFPCGPEDGYVYFFLLFKCLSSIYLFVGGPMVDIATNELVGVAIMKYEPQVQ